MNPWLLEGAAGIPTGSLTYEPKGPKDVNARQVKDAQSSTSAWNSQGKP